MARIDTVDPTRIRRAALDSFERRKSDITKYAETPNTTSPKAIPPTKYSILHLNRSSFVHRQIDEMCSVRSQTGERSTKPMYPRSILNAQTWFSTDPPSAQSDVVVTTQKRTNTKVTFRIGWEAVFTLTFNWNSRQEKNYRGENRGGLKQATTDHFFTRLSVMGCSPMLLPSA